MTTDNYAPDKHNYFIPLDSLGLLQISGQDAVKFLQGQTTCDIHLVSDQQSQPGAFCNPQGRIIANFFIFRSADYFYLLMPREIVPQVIESLKKYAVFFKCELIDASDVWEKIGLQGDQLAKNIRTFTRIDLNNATNTVISIEEETWLLRIPGHTQRYIFLGKNLQSYSTNFFFEHSFISANELIWKLADIQANLVTISLDTTGKFTPHDINFPAIGGVSFNKGCYTGQEIIARMHYLGKLKQHLQKIAIAGQQNFLPGTALFADDKIAGQLVDGVLFEDHYFGLAVLRDDVLHKPLTLAKHPVEVILLDK